jgi:PAS domain S-box-containing protein
MNTPEGISFDDVRVLLAHLPDAALLIDPHNPAVQWPIMACNEAACRMNGYLPDELMGQPLDLLHLVPSTTAGRAALLSRIRHEGTVRGRSRHKRRDGTIVPVEYSASFVTIANRQLIIGIDRDVSHSIRTETALGDTDTRLRLLVDQLPAVLWTTDRDLRYTSSTGAGLARSGQAASEVIGTTVYEMFKTRDPLYPPIRAHLEALEGKSTSYETEQFGRVFEVYVEPYFDSAREICGCIGVGLDITERVRAEAGFRTIFEESPTGMTIIGLDYRFQRANRAFCAILGYTEQELVGMSTRDVTHPEDADDDLCFTSEMFACARTDYIVERRYITKGRKVIWGRLTATLLRDSDDKPLAVLGIVENITGRKRTDLLLEAERRRVAYELHDSLAQVLASTHFRLQALASRYHPRSPEARADLEQAVELARQAVREARRIISGLRPTALDDFGLAVALKKEVETLATAGWEITFEGTLENERLPPAVETALFWVAQEALTNIRKHAGQTRVRLSLALKDGNICLDIQDWGRGFDPATLTTRSGPGEQIGLLGMQERVAVLGGICEVHSRPDSGTTIMAQVPLPVPSSQDGQDAFWTN